MFYSELTAVEYSLEVSFYLAVKDMYLVFYSTNAQRSIFIIFIVFFFFNSFNFLFIGICVCLYCGFGTGQYTAAIDTMNYFFQRVIKKKKKLTNKNFIY